MLGVAKYNVQLDGSALKYGRRHRKKAADGVDLISPGGFRKITSVYRCRSVLHHVFRRGGPERTDVEYQTMGLIFQAGINYYLDNKFSLNLDVKKYLIEPI